MAYTETTNRSWFGRLRDSLKGIIVGIIFVAIGVMVLFWGEGRAVKRAKALKEGAANVMSVSASGPQAQNEGKLVHFSGLTQTYEELRDDLFGIIANGVKLERRVEMYQWQENKESEERKKLGGGTETVTTYTYEKTWSTRQIDSDSFKESGHDNPSFPFAGEEYVADPVVIGDWILGSVFVGQLSNTEQKSVTEADLSGVSQVYRDGLQVKNGGFYLAVDGGSGASTEIGDVRVSFQVVPHSSISVVGRQVAQSLMSYEAKSGSNIHLLQYGTVPASAMFETAKKQNTTLTWILRFVGFFVIFLGFAMILKPLSVVADVVPFFGNIVETGTTFVAFVLAAIIALLTIAIGWIFYRPLLGVTLLVVVGVLLWWIFKKLKQSEAKIHDRWTGQSPSGQSPSGPAPGAPPPPPPPPPG